MTSMHPSAIELRHLRYFSEVARAAHFTRAAAALNISQPTLSHQIRTMEDRVGVALFDRTGGKVSLTSAGELLLPYAQRVLRELEEASKALSDLHGMKRGNLRIGTLHTVHSCITSEIISRYTAAHPGIRVRHEELTATEVEDGLANGQFDLGLGFLPTKRRDVEGRPLFVEELVAVVAEKHPLAPRKSLRIRDLAECPLALLVQPYYTRALIADAFTKAKTKLKVQVEMNSIENILRTVRQGGLVTILPRLATCRDDHDLRAIRLTAPTPRRTIGLLWPKNLECRLATKAFAKLAEEALAERLGKQFCDQETLANGQYPAHPIRSESPHRPRTS